MSRQTYYNLAGLIKTKLLALNDDDGDDLFVEVLDYGEAQFTGYPSAVILVSAGDGEVRDTARNDRVFEFTIDLYQEYSEGGKTKKEARDAMVKAIDKVIEAFDTDNNLGGNVIFIEVIPLILDTVVRSGTFLFGQFKVRCHDLVNNY